MKETKANLRGYYHYIPEKFAEICLWLQGVESAHVSILISQFVNKEQYFVLCSGLWVPQGWVSYNNVCKSSLIFSDFNAVKGITVVYLVKLWWGGCPHREWPDHMANWDTPYTRAWPRKREKLGYVSAHPPPTGLRLTAKLWVME